jgi:CHRD domain
MRLDRIVTAAALLLIGTSSALADDEDVQFSANARLNGFREVPPILSDGRGRFTGTLDGSGTSLSFTLAYSGLSSTATVAHIHFAQAGVAGNIIAFLCGGGGKPACPAAGGMVTGTITATDILAVPSQNITAGSFSDFLRVLRSGDAYVNVYTSNFSAGEIRGQIRTDN